jgi:predicted dehydrogenase
VIGVLGSRPARSEEAARSWGVEAAYADLDALIADRPDMVHICTPNATHAPYAEALARAGIHVVVEKPVATTVAEAERLQAAVRESGVVAAVPYVYRYHPMVREIRARRQAGELGEVALVHGSYLQDWMLSPDVSSWRVDPEQGGASRAFADIGTHWCDLAEFVSGESFAEVNATTSITHSTRPAAGGASFSGAVASSERAEVVTEDIATATFRTDRGVLANAVISQVSAGRKNRLWLEVDGTSASAVFDQERPESVWFGGEDGSLTVHRGEGRISPDQACLNRTPAGHPQGWSDAFDAFVADAHAAACGESPEGLPTIADGVRSVRLVEAVLESAREGTWASV